MCDFCNNSGKRIKTEFDKEEKDDANFNLLIYGNHYLRINAIAIESNSMLRGLPTLWPETVEIKFCPMCGEKLN